MVLRIVTEVNVFGATTLWLRALDYWTKWRRMLHGSRSLLCAALESLPTGRERASSCFAGCYGHEPRPPTTAISALLRLAPVSWLAPSRLNCRHVHVEEVA